MPEPDSKPEPGPSECHLRVSIATQQLLLCDGTTVRNRYAVSTSRYGTGSEADSYRTPLGWHEIAAKIGGDQPIGTAFVGRRPQRHAAVTAQVAGRDRRDRILSRILRLRGLEPGLNAGPGMDSYQRYIYIHGTDEERSIGQPVSMGCIRMINRDIVDLYEHVCEHTRVYITV